MSDSDYYVLNKRHNKFLGKDYYTFQDLKTVLESNSDVSLTLHKPEAKCTMTPDISTTIVLNQNLADLLGFGTQIFLRSRTTKSGTIQVNHG